MRSRAAASSSASCSATPMVTHKVLRDREADARLAVERKLDGPLWHLTRLRPA